MWDLPRPGLEPVSPALASRFSTTAPPGKPGRQILNHCATREAQPWNFEMSLSSPTNSTSKYPQKPSFSSPFCLEPPCLVILTFCTWAITSTSNLSPWFQSLYYGQNDSSNTQIPSLSISLKSFSASLIVRAHKVQISYHSIQDLLTSNLTSI